MFCRQEDDVKALTPKLMIESAWHGMIFASGWKPADASLDVLDPEMGRYRGGSASRDRGAGRSDRLGRGSAAPGYQGHRLYRGGRAAH
jgi:hypothetical protein